MAGVFSIILFFIVIIITAGVFFGWIAITIVRGLFNGVASLIHPSRPAAAVSHTVRCSTPGCGATNPTEARFCRRCGHDLPEAQRVQVRRAAVW
jgi:hypothetical protein